MHISLEGPSPHPACNRGVQPSVISHLAFWGKTQKSSFGHVSGSPWSPKKLALDSSYCCLQDMGELEAGVGQSVYPLDRLGLPFNILRAFRRLLFLGTSEVPASPLLRELPPSVVLHHLYSRASAALKSPHIRHSFTPAQVCLVLSTLAFAHWTLGLSVAVLRLMSSRAGAERRLSMPILTPFVHLCTQLGISCCFSSAWPQVVAP